MKKLLCLLPLLFSCGQPLLQGTEVDSEIQQYVDVAVTYLGEKEGNKKIRKIKLTDSCRQRDASGECITNATCWKEMDFSSPYHGNRVIEINRKRWEKKNTYSRYGTIIHEIMHCAYDINHNSRKHSLINSHSEDVISQADFERALKADKRHEGFN